MSPFEIYYLSTLLQESLTSDVFLLEMQDLDPESSLEPSDSGRKTDPGHLTSYFMALNKKEGTEGNHMSRSLNHTKQFSEGSVSVKDRRAEADHWRLSSATN